MLKWLISQNVNYLSFCRISLSWLDESTVVGFSHSLIKFCSHYLQKCFPVWSPYNTISAFRFSNVPLCCQTGKKPVTDVKTDQSPEVIWWSRHRWLGDYYYCRSPTDAKVDNFIFTWKFSLVCLQLSPFVPFTKVVSASRFVEYSLKICQDESPHNHSAKITLKSALLVGVEKNLWIYQAFILTSQFTISINIESYSKSSSQMTHSSMFTRQFSNWR